MIFSDDALEVAAIDAGRHGDKARAAALLKDRLYHPSLEQAFHSLLAANRKGKGHHFNGGALAWAFALTSLHHASALDASRAAGRAMNTVYEAGRLVAP